MRNCNKKIDNSFVSCFIKNSEGVLQNVRMSSFNERENFIHIMMSRSTKSDTLYFHNVKFNRKGEEVCTAPVVFKRGTEEYVSILKVYDLMEELDKRNIYN